jgi:hypothetical protein
VRLSAAVSTSLRSALAGPARPATWLGVTPVALYLRIAGEPGALALLAHDAVRLPCALLLPSTGAELPLTSLAVPDGGTPVVGDGVLAWPGPAGLVVVRAVREWAPARAGRGTVLASALAAVRAALPAPAALGIDRACLPMLTDKPAAAVARLLGRGPGLTPAGDDVLAGFLVGAGAFGLDAAGVRAAIAALAPARTTALSAALLWHASRGDCVDEVAVVAAALIGDSQPQRCQVGPALGQLLAVGHTSGAALAVGLVAAADAACRAAAGTTALYAGAGTGAVRAGTGTAGAAA